MNSQIRSIKVWERDYEVIVSQNSRSVWIAVGDYEGQEIRATGRTPAQAAASWRVIAQRRGDG